LYYGFRVQLTLSNVVNQAAGRKKRLSIAERRQPHNRLFCAVINPIESLRRQRLTGRAIAAEIGVSAATVCCVLQRLGLHKLSALEPAPSL
jgi:hypothetical protein